jgi:GIY-YIG catalytic domain
MKSICYKNNWGFDSRRLHQTSLETSYVPARQKKRSLSRRSHLGEGGHAMNFYYVYILQSKIDQKRFYTGFTEDLDSRLKSQPK